MVLLRKISDYLIHNKFLYLLISIVIYCVLNATLETSHGRYFLNFVFSLVILFSLYTIGGSKRPIIVLLTILGVSLVLLLWSGGLFGISETMKLAQIGLGFAFFTLVTVTTLVYVSHDKEITAGTLFGAISSYLLIGLSWCYLFLLIALISPEAFVYNGVAVTADIPLPDMLYHSFVTLTTLGYGDIVPVSGIAKVTCWLEAVSGQIYLAIRIAQLVGLYISSNARKQKEPSS